MTTTPPLALEVAAGRSDPAIVRYANEPAPLVGPAKNWFAAVLLSIVAAIVTVSPLVVVVMLTMPVVLPLAVFSDPAALRLTHADPFQI